MQQELFSEPTLDERIQALKSEIRRIPVVPKNRRTFLIHQGEEAACMLGGTCYIYDAHGKELGRVQRYPNGGFSAKWKFNPDEAAYILFFVKNDRFILYELHDSAETIH